MRARGRRRRLPSSSCPHKNASQLMLLQQSQEKRVTVGAGYLMEIPLEYSRLALSYPLENLAWALEVKGKKIKAFV
jgi:hypothetical protein